MRRPMLVLAALTATLVACGSSDKAACDPGAQTGCITGKACELVENAGPACFDPVVLQGTVFDLATQASVVGARLVALDANRAPVSTVATSGATGAFTLTVPAQRKADGTPVAASLTLRADASGYQSFPGGVRTALPIDLSSATHTNAIWTVQSPLTAVGLIPLPAGARASVHGTVALPPNGVGVLVVAQPVAGGAGVTGVADKEGKYAIFNLPVSGTASYSVQAYARGSNYNAATQAVAAGDDAPVNLTIKNTTTATVSGAVQPTGQNLPPNPTTSVILVVKSTFDATLGRGEAPPGLRAGGITGSYSIAGVPDGSYIALGAFENDGIVRDVSGIGGTAPVETDVQDGAVTLAPASFKLTGAVSLTSPFVAPYDVAPWPASSATPTFGWTDYPSIGQGSYQVSVADAFGNVVAGPIALPKTTTAFTTPALAAGMYYQLRVVVLDTGASPISKTEDLKGVFFVP